ncbi:hypothetical protein ACE6H2_010003 [Prunus campanulata]
MEVTHQHKGILTMKMRMALIILVLLAVQASGRNDPSDPHSSLDSFATYVEHPKKIAHAISHEVGGIGSAIKGLFHKKPSLVKTASLRLLERLVSLKRLKNQFVKSGGSMELELQTFQKQKIFLKQLLLKNLQSTLLEALLEYQVDSLQMIKQCIWIL